MKTIVAFVVLLLACDSMGYSMRDRFTDFMKTFDKKYETREEFDKRYMIFSHNMGKIDGLNKQKQGLTTYNVTRFADMTLDEFRSYPCGVDKLASLEGPQPVISEFPAELANIQVPDSWDWTTKGAVTPVKDQGQCGSCWAFSTIGNMEGVWFLAGHPLTSLSEQELVDCSTTSYGCGGGWPYWALKDLEGAPASGRIDTETGYPYVAENQQCGFKSSDVGATYKSFKSYCTEATAACTEAQMQQLLVTYGPLSACLDATPMQFYSGGIDNPKDCDPNSIDHCITIVGYGTQNGVNFWKIKNSWSASWGEKGYYYLIRGTGACGINKVITIADVKN